MTIEIESILADLVAIPSLPGTPNAAIVDRVRAELARHGVESAVIAGPEGDRFNLFATIGPRDRPGYILSGHMDVVPAEGQVWATDPFRLASDGVRLSGRGTTDMKGFLACVLAMVPEFLAHAADAPGAYRLFLRRGDRLPRRRSPDRAPPLALRPAGGLHRRGADRDAAGPVAQGQAGAGARHRGAGRPFLEPCPRRERALSGGGAPALHPRPRGAARGRGAVRRALQPAACDAPGRGHSRRQRRQHHPGPRVDRDRGAQRPRPAAGRGDRRGRRRARRARRSGDGRRDATSGSRIGSSRAIRRCRRPRTGRSPA